MNLSVIDVFHLLRPPYRRAYRMDVVEIEVVIQGALLPKFVVYLIRLK